MAWVENEKLTQYFACTKKQKFTSEKTARDRLRKIAKQGYIIPHNASVYKCNYCSGWHLGHRKET